MSLRRHVLTTLTTGATALTLLAAGPAGANSDPIQPGDYIRTGGSACTLNFVYDGGGKVYLGTAAHCVGKVGDDVSLISGEVFGDVAVIGDEDVTEDDWALIRVRPAFVARVSPAVKGNPSYPRGYTTPGETAFGDVVQLSGYGIGFNATTTTQERRNAVMGYDDTEYHNVIGPLIFGDSGGPLVHVRSGKALGIVSRLCIGLCEEEGPTVQGILARAAAKGFAVTLRTV